MFIKKFALCSLLFALCACTGTKQWNPEYGNEPATNTPSEIQSGYYTSAPATSVGKIAVLLPTTGTHGALGRGISNAIQMAMISRPGGTSISFHDISGDTMSRTTTMQSVIASNPNIILGPLFAEDARIIRDIKPAELPVLSFTSDADALGGGVMTMALIPSNSVEESIKQIARDGGTNIVVIAPQTASGELMAGAARYAANAHNIGVAGIIYYTEGDTNSIKNAASAATMYPARTAANDKAREILSDIISSESLSAAQKSSLRTQLNKIGKSETLGKVPYDAALLLGNASDSKTVVSFIRYFEVSNRDAPIYGTALWDGEHKTMSDFMMAGAKYPALAPQSEFFKTMYEQTFGHVPSRMDGFGYDAANLAVGMLRAGGPAGQYLLNPNGYTGTDGIFRLRPSGASERALQIMELAGADEPIVVRPAVDNFIAPMYYVNPTNIGRAGPMSLRGPGINPTDYITIPENLKYKYRGQTFGANTEPDVGANHYSPSEIEIMPEDDREIIITPNFTPVASTPVTRQVIDEIVIYE